MKKKRDYTVGYGKPPASGQFKRGKSGNPKGRPKDSLSFDTDLSEVLNGKVTVTENGKTKKVTSQKAILMRLLAAALQGKYGPMEKIVGLAKDLSTERELQVKENRLSVNDEQILESFAEDLIANARRKEGGWYAHDED